MTDLEPEERLTRAQTWSALAWTIGPLGILLVTLKILIMLFPDRNPLMLFALAVIPETAILYGVARWRTRSTT